ncbi:hypothetical protein U9M48_035035 [Paspalum notatum var. saurae]|uniref:Peptidase A1 domain-containing protein n=1 Tax=Paspalum notatum var. saurae TaxID=547442 RepID=A0AAQ3UAD4_PASNO
MGNHLRLLPLLWLALSVTATASTGFRAVLNHPYAAVGGGGSSSISNGEMLRRSAAASRARMWRLHARLVANNASMPVAALTDQGYTVTVGIGTPPQPQTLILDTASDLCWTQCKLFWGTARQRGPLYDPARSSSFASLPCSDGLCQLAPSLTPTTPVCAHTTNIYGSAASKGLIVSDAFDFRGDKDTPRPSLTFGCGLITKGDFFGASGIMGLDSMSFSVLSQLNMTMFSYCFTPFAERKAGHLFLGATAMEKLQEHSKSGAIQSTPLLRFSASPSPYYCVQLVGLSLGAKRLAVPAATFARYPTIVDSGSTIAYLVHMAFRVLKEAILETVKLPVANRTVEDYELCFFLPRGVAMGAVQAPPLVLHFDGGAAMVLPRDSYFQEPRVGLMCLAVGSTQRLSIIGNVQQQNMHVLFDVHNSRLFFAPTQCDNDPSEVELVLLQCDVTFSLVVKELVGDGTTTVVLLAVEFLKEAKPYIDHGFWAMEISACCCITMNPLQPRTIHRFPTCSHWLGVILEETTPEELRVGCIDVELLLEETTPEEL